MKWVNTSEVDYNPIDGQKYVVYLSSGATLIAIYNKRIKSYIEVFVGEVYDEESVSFVIQLTNPWVELKENEAI